MPRGRPRQPILLTQQQREQLQSIIRKGNTPQKLARRARIILMSADDIPNVQIAQKLDITNPAVCYWRKRFFIFGFDGLFDAPRSGAPRSMTDQKVAQVIELTLQTKPEGQTCWSTRTMAQRAGLSHSSIGRIWRAFVLVQREMDF